MKGVIVAMNRRKGFYAVRVDDGGITVFEMLDSHEPEVGDVISGRLDVHMGERLYNETQRERFDVYIQGVHCSDSAATALMR